MARDRRGSIRIRPNGIFARVTYIDDTGKRQDKTRKAQNKTEARELIKQMLREIDDHGERILDSSRMLFDDLADYFEERYLIDAVYRSERKVSGLRSYKDSKRHLRILRDHFGRKKLRDIRYGDIEKFKVDRLAIPTRRGGERSIADVNRTLAVMRHILTIAFREGFIPRNPFSMGKPLIDTASEVKRERVITPEEEERLLNAATGPRAHIKPIIIAALDTGLRRGELFKLTWADVDLPRRRITVRALNSKTLRARQVPITERLAAEFERLSSSSLVTPETRVFGIENNISKAWYSVRREAGLAGLRLHDLRHTAATRLVQQGLPIAELARILGHSTPVMSYRYVNQTDETIDRAADLLNSYHANAKRRELTISEERSEWIA